MVPIDYGESTTLNSPTDRAPADRPLLPALTILHHADLDRVGDVAVFPTGGGARAEMAISRNTPHFVRPGGLDAAPLGDPCLSRTAWKLCARFDGGSARLEGDPGGWALEIDGESARGAFVLDAAALARGAVLTLGRRVVLLAHLTAGPARALEPSVLVGASDAMVRLRESLARVADQDGLSVLIRGETGTGKELVARAIHAGSRRAGGPFVPVNLAALPPSLMAAELFGYKKGAFSGAETASPGAFGRANGGTLFLDEIGAMPLESQNVLLRTLQDGVVEQLGGHTVHVDVRVLAATDAPLERLLDGGRFGAPLYHRLSRFVVHTPALRTRRDDVGRLLAHLLRHALAAVGEQGRLRRSQEEPLWFPAALAARLCAYDWPGNVRELENVVQSIVIESRGRETARLPEALGARLAAATAAASADAAPGGLPGAAPPGTTEVSDAELAEVLRRCKWNVRAAARQLGIAANTLYGLIEASPTLRLAKDIGRDELADCLRRFHNDLPAVAAHFGVSARGLAIRMRELDLGPEGDRSG
jgi:two-component system nitrogen regulation response regulator GlnG